MASAISAVQAGSSNGISSAAAERRIRARCAFDLVDGAVDDAAALEAPVSPGESEIVGMDDWQGRIDQPDPENADNLIRHAARLPTMVEMADDTDLAARLRSRGLRMTPQREQVLAAVRALGHATPEKIGEAVPGVDITTVYRTLELLEQLGLVRHTHLGHGAPTFRPAEDDHVHVVCHTCGRVVDAPHSLADDLAERLRVEQRFPTRPRAFHRFRTMPDCLATEQTSPAKTMRLT